MTSRGYYAYWFGSYRLSAVQAQAQNTFTLSYDAVGNITQKGDLALTYNQANRLATAKKGSMNAAYRYNGNGLRSSKTVNGKRTDYIYSSGRLLAWKDATGWHDNIYLNGEILATVDNGQIHYHENDYQGKALRLVDKNGKTVWTADWEPYRESDKPRQGINNPQRFAGQILDEETGFYYNINREYDPQTGRYTQSDPIGLNGGVNTYAYVGGNPVMFVDPLGLESNQCIAGIETASCRIQQAGGIKEATNDAYKIIGKEALHTSIEIAPIPALKVPKLLKKLRRVKKIDGFIPVCVVERIPSDWIKSPNKKV